MFGFFFAERLPQNYDEVMATDKERFNRFFHAMLERRRLLRAALVRSRASSAPRTAPRTSPPPCRRRSARCKRRRSARLHSHPVAPRARS
jgi:hypothetical protein